MLDGGGSSAFIYKFAGERHTYDQGTPVPTIVRGSYDD